jgi:hypothetical protein
MTPIMDEWIDRLADTLGDPRPTPAEAGQVLKLAREVAHRLERKLAPLSAFVAGVYVGRESALGTAREEALRDALRAARELLPPSSRDQSATGSDPNGADRGTA